MGAQAVVGISARRARLGQRQLLAASRRADAPLEVARAIVAIHATDPATVYLSSIARLSQPDLSEIEAALYDRRHMVRMLGMRRTMFVVPLELAPVVQAACTVAIAAQERRRTLQIFAQAGFGDDLETWLADIEKATLTALRKRGEATAQELGKDVPALRRQIVTAAGKDYEGLLSVATRVLMQLSAEGHIVRGRPRGSWISSQFRWTPIDTLLPDGLPVLSRAAAQVELVRRWLHAFGPGTLADLKWWTGLTMADVKRALSELRVVEVDLEPGTGVMLEDDLAQLEPPVEPWVAFLPALDSTPMGYTEREWFLGRHTPMLFDRSGNIGPTVWSDGRVVGGWAQRKNGAIAYKLLEDVGAESERAIANAAHDLARLIGPVGLTPRFRTPLERELSA